MNGFYKLLKALGAGILAAGKWGGASDELMVAKPVRVVVRSRR